MNKGILGFLALLAVIIIGLGVWVATPQGGGGIGEDGPAGGAGGVATPGSADDADDRSEGAVEIVNGRFEPSTVQVIGQANVTFINRDDVAHGIDFESKDVPDVDSIAPGAAHVAEMPRKGRYPFSDPTDPALEGTVVVGG